jgi:inhibitor of KinA
MKSKLEIKAFGDRAILLEFEQRIAPEINLQVKDWADRIKAADFPGFSHLIPAYASLTVVFDQPLTDVNTTIQHIQALSSIISKASDQQPRLLTIPVCYAEGFAPDQQEVMDKLRLTWPEVIALHTQATYRVYMIGFSPGFAYLGILHKYLQINRKDTPRLKVPARSVGLAGAQTGIYPDELPGGWQLIGRTPIPPFSPLREKIFLFEAGDEVKFKSITPEEYYETEVRIKEKRFDWGSLIK